MQKENQESLVLERTIKQINEQFNQYIMNNDNQNKNGREQSLQKENQETLVLERTIKQLNEQFNQYIDNQNKNGREQSLDNRIFNTQQRVIKRLTEENKELKEQIMKYQSFIKSIKQNINNLGK